MAVLIGEASEVARGRQGQKWVGQMVWEHHVSMTPRTEVSVCERETIGERKKKLLGSEIVTEREVGQFFWKKWETAHGLCGVGEWILHGLVQGSSGASGRANDQETEALKMTPVGVCAKKDGQRLQLFWVEKGGCTAEMALPRWQKGGLHCDDLESRQRQVCRAVGLRPVTGSKGWGHVSSKLGTLFGPRSCRYCEPGSGLCPGPTQGYAQGLAWVQSEGRRRG